MDYQRSGKDFHDLGRISKSRRGFPARRAARSPRQHHRRRRAVSRSPSPQTQSQQSQLVLTPAEPDVPKSPAALPQHTSPSAAQLRQRDDGRLQRRWHQPSPKRTVLHRGGGAPDVYAQGSARDATARAIGASDAIATASSAAARCRSYHDCQLLAGVDSQASAGVATRDMAQGPTGGGGATDVHAQSK